MMDEGKIIINMQGGSVIAGGTFSNVEFVANKYVMTGEKGRRDRYEEAEEVQEETEDNVPASAQKEEIPESVKECFRFTSDFVKQHVQAIVKEFYMDKPVYLALIERTLYDHNILLKSNSHTLFICALMDWGILSEDTDIRKTANGMATKFRNIPTEGYKTWDNYHLNDRNLCSNIGKKLSDSMRYSR